MTAALKHRFRIALDQPRPRVEALLEHLAGEHAEAIALHWPAPHAEFLVLPAARRHAAAMLLSRARPVRGDGPAIRQLVERRRDSELARELAGHPAPQGLIKALRKFGEVLWSAESYSRFLSVFAEPGANRLLRHLKEVRPAQLGLIAELSPPLRDARILARLESAAAAQDLQLAFELAVRMHGRSRIPALVESWQRADSRFQLFGRAQDALLPEQFVSGGQVPELPACFIQIRSRDMLDRTALDFRNCLRDFVLEIAKGRLAVFVVHGSVPVALALARDECGWRLAEAETHDNEPLADHQLRDLVSMLNQAGVRTGPSVKTLRFRLGEHSRGIVPHDQPGPGWRERLELGDLWD